MMGSSPRVSCDLNPSLFLKLKPPSCIKKKDWSIINKGAQPPFKHTLCIVRPNQEEGFPTLLAAMVQVDQELVVEGAVADPLPSLPLKVVVQSFNANSVAVLVTLHSTAGTALMKISSNQHPMRPTAQMTTPPTTLLRLCLPLLPIKLMILGILTLVPLII